MKSRLILSRVHTLLLLDKILRWNDDGFTAYWRKASRSNKFVSPYTLQFTTHRQCEIILFLSRHAHHWPLSPQFDPSSRLSLFFIDRSTVSTFDDRLYTHIDKFIFFFLIISIFVTVPSANNNNARDNRGNAWNREHFQTQIREFVRWIKALSSFSREEIRGRWRERWNSIFQSCIRKQWWRGGIGQTGRLIRPVSSLRYRNGSNLSLSLSLIHTLFFHSIFILLITYYF